MEIITLLEIEKKELMKYRSPLSLLDEDKESTTLYMW
jgi:hypothetical protein